MKENCLPGAEAPSREEAIKLLEGGYGVTLLRSAARYVVPIFWGDPRSRDEDAILDSGSLFFLECGGPVMGVTCEHVLQGWERDKAKKATTICQVDELRIDPLSRVIDRDADLDLATMRFTEEEVSKLRKWIYRRSPDQWPPAPPEEGKGVFFAGFPGGHRRTVDHGTLEFGVYTCLGVATRVYDDRIVYQFEREYFVDVLGLGVPLKNEWLGGMSGAPLWSVTAFGWRLAGVIYEWSTDYELLYGRRADAIRPDGTLAPIM